MNDRSRPCKNHGVLRLLGGRCAALVCAESVLFVVIWLFLLSAGRSAMFRDPGSFWHAAAGEKMLATGEVLRADPYSFTFAGRPWICDQWLAECIMAAVRRAADWDGLLLLTASLLAAVYTWIGARLLRAGLHWLPVGLLLAWILLLGAPQFHVRPLVATIALLSVAFAWLVDVEAGRKRIGQLWWLVPLFALWANLHPGALGGMGTVALCAVGWCVAGWLGRPSPVRRWTDVVQLGALCAALAAAALINPYGLDMPRQWLQTLAMPLPSLIDEHVPLDWASPNGAATVLLVAGYVAVLGATLPRGPRVAWLLPLVWFVLTVQRVRNGSLFGVTAAIALADMLPCSRVGRWLERRAMLGPPRSAAGWPAAMLPLVLVGAAAAVQCAGVRIPLVGRGWAQFDAARWPVALLPQLDAIHRQSEDGTPIFNDLNFGGFLIDHAPRLRVFVDDRCALYGGEFLTRYDLARREDPAQIERWRRQYGFRFALVESGGRFDRYLAGSEAWRLVARTPPAALYQSRMGDVPDVR